LATPMAWLLGRQARMNDGIPFSLRDSALTSWPGRDGFCRALSCDFWRGGWSVPGSGAHLMGAVIVAGGLGDRSAGLALAVIAGLTCLAVKSAPVLGDYAVTTRT